MDSFSIFCGLVALLCSLLWYIGTKNYNIWKKNGVFHVKPVFPFLGNISLKKLIMEPIVDVIDEVYDRFPGKPYVGLYFFTRPALFVRDPELIKQILVKDFTYFPDRGFHVNDKSDPLSKNLIFIDHGPWKTSRPKLQVAFNSNKLKSGFPTIDKIAKKMMDRIDFEENYSNKGQLDVSNWCARFAVDAASSYVLGVDSNTIEDYKDSEFFQLTKDVFTEYNFPVNTFTCFFFPRLHEFFGFRLERMRTQKFFLALKEKLTDLIESPGKATRSVFMESLLTVSNDIKNHKENDTHNNSPNGLANGIHKDKSDYFNDYFVIANMYMFLCAGYESASKMASFCLFELAYSEEIQNKARAEVLKVLSEHDNKMTYEAVQKMVYIEQIVNEANRKYPSLNVIFRKCAKRYTMPDGGVVEPGTPVIIPSCSLHFDPAYFPKPNEFIPERFDEENKNNIVLGSNLPFGMGPKMCIAWQYANLKIKVLIARMLLKYRFHLHPSFAEYPMKFRPKAFILAPNSSILVNYTKLENQIEID